MALLVMLGWGPAHGHGTDHTDRPVVSGRTETTPPTPGTYDLPLKKPVPDGMVLDEAGVRRPLREMFGPVLTIVSFIYARCEDPSGCPAALGTLNAAAVDVARADDLRDKVTFLTVSFDPTRDTPEVMAALAMTLRPDIPGVPPWHFLTTASMRDLRPILDGFGQPVFAAPERGTGFDIAHLLRAYLIDDQHRIRQIYGLETLDPAFLLADMRTLLARRE